MALLRRIPAPAGFRALTRPATPSEIQRATRPAVFRGASKLPRAVRQVERRTGFDLGPFKAVSQRDGTTYITERDSGRMVSRIRRI